MLAILFWVFWFIGLFGGAFYRWPGGPTPAYGVDILVMLLIGALGLRVFPIGM